MILSVKILKKYWDIAHKPRGNILSGGDKSVRGEGLKKYGIGGQASMGGLALDGGGPPIPIHWTALPETHILRSGWLFVAEP